MWPCLTERFGNASSAQHPFGWAAREAVEQARGQVAALIGAPPRDIVFTSGATESNSPAIQGAVRALRDRGRQVVTLATEHTAVLDACTALEGDGVEVTRLGVDERAHRSRRVNGRELLLGLSDLSLSSGAACYTASAEPSHVLKAIGLSR